MIQELFDARNHLKVLNQHMDKKNCYQGTGTSFKSDLFLEATLKQEFAGTND